MKALLIAWWLQLTRELLIHWRRLSSSLNSLMFFGIMVVLFPLGIAPDPALLHTIAPGVIWIGALLASMLSHESLFQQDYEDGTLEQLLLHPAPLSLLVFAKIMAHWLITALPLLVMTPLLGMMLHLTASEIGILMLSLLIGTPILSCINAIVAAVTLSLASKGVLLAILMLPLCIPVLIFGAGSVVAVMTGVPAAGLLLLLLAMFFLTLVLAPLATATALRWSQW